ncbi:hypothetical protein D9M71_814550 [compost metagenome]
MVSLAFVLELKRGYLLERSLPNKRRLDIVLDLEAKARILSLGRLKSGEGDEVVVDEVEDDERRFLI